MRGLELQLETVLLQAFVVDEVEAVFYGGAGAVARSAQRFTTEKGASLGRFLT